MIKLNRWGVRKLNSERVRWKDIEYHLYHADYYTEKDERGIMLNEIEFRDARRKLVSHLGAAKLRRNLYEILVSEFCTYRVKPFRKEFFRVRRALQGTEPCISLASDSIFGLFNLAGMVRLKIYGGKVYVPDKEIISGTGVDINMELEKYL